MYVRMCVCVCVCVCLQIDDDTSGQVYSDLFQVDSLLHLQLKQGKSLNYEAVKTYHIPVTCADKLAPFNTIASILTVNVKGWSNLYTIMSPFNHSLYLRDLRDRT